MSNLFEQKKEEIKAAASQNIGKNGEPKKLFSKAQFNELAAAYLNSPDFVDHQVKSKDGELCVVETTPVKDFRDTIVGGIAKAAGLDKTEQEKLADSYQFSSKADYHSFMSNVIEAYAGECGRKFSLTPRSDMKASLTIETVPETTKVVKVVGTDKEKTVKYGEFRKVKVKSTCPDNLRQDL